MSLEGLLKGWRAELSPAPPLALPQNLGPALPRRAWKRDWVSKAQAPPSLSVAEGSPECGHCGPFLLDFFTWNPTPSLFASQVWSP